MIGLADRFHCLPSQAVQEEAGIIRMLKVYKLGHIEDEGGEDA